MFLNTPTCPQRFRNDSNFKVSKIELYSLCCFHHIVRSLVVTGDDGNQSLLSMLVLLLYADRRHLFSHETPVSHPVPPPKTTNENIVVIVADLRRSRGKQIDPEQHTDTQS